MARPLSLTSALLTAGFTQSARAQSLLAELAGVGREELSLETPLPVGAGPAPGLSPGGGPGDEADSVAQVLTVGALVSVLATTADPDGALLALVQLAEMPSLARGRPAPTIVALLDARLCKLLATSQFFARYLQSHPPLVAQLSQQAQESDLASLPPVFASYVKALGLQNVGSEENPCWVADGAAQVHHLRQVYWQRLALIALLDVNAEVPMTVFTQVGRAITDLIDATLEAGLALARRDLDPTGQVGLAIIAMGKTGARELNYISDVDVIYAACPGPGQGLDQNLDQNQGQDQSQDQGQGQEEARSLSESQLLERATSLAIALASICSAVGPGTKFGPRSPRSHDAAPYDAIPNEIPPKEPAPKEPPLFEPPLWSIDAALRPEGKDGPLVRTLASHEEYYQKWAKSWEFQALLKARAAAGDRQLGQEFVDFTSQLVWQAASGAEFVEDARQMRSRVEASVPAKVRERELKLGRGGLRDIEFTVQLLQLVHGRSDESLRRPATLDALEALVTGGYMGRDHGAALGQAYRAERVLEHRTQLWQMRRTHVLPQGEDLRRVGRSIDPQRFPDAPATSKWWQGLRKEVRALHEDIYYRPLLPATAQLSVQDAALSPTAARERLAAIGYRDPAGALAHINALTEGVSRRAAIQRQLLPVLLGWFADGVDPDAGLLGFRQISEALGDTHWYMRLLRDSGHAAQRLTTILSSSPLVAKILPTAPEVIAWLDSEQELANVSRAALEEQIGAMAGRHGELASAARRLQTLRSREIMRCAMLDVAEKIEVGRTAFLLTEIGEGILAGALHLALRTIWAEYLPNEQGCSGQQSAAQNAQGPQIQVQPSDGPVGLADLDGAMAGASGPAALWTAGPCAQYLVVAMGRFGGAECGYASDADVQFIYVPRPGHPAEAAAREGTRVARLVGQILSGPGPGSWQVDTALRPEGKNGPAARSLDSTIDYYARHRSAWEVQALLRARPVVGAPELRAEYVRRIDPLRYEAQLTEADYREIRRLKARMENERIARGAPANQNIKLGPGGLSDVEWTVQLAQLRHSAEIPTLRTTSTKEALQAAWSAGLFSSEQTQALEQAWTFATQIRAANVLGLGTVRGSKLDQLPTGFALQVVARLLGYGPGQERDLVDDWLRTARHGRTVVEELFYG